MEILGKMLPVVYAIICVAIIYSLVTAKFSYARLREEQLDEMEFFSDDEKDYLRHLYKNPEGFINTAQYLILLFIIIFAAVLAYMMHDVLSASQSYIPWKEEWISYVVNVLITLFVSMVVLIFGEIIPKALGLSFPERYILRGAKVVNGLGRIVRPFVWIGTRVGDFFLRNSDTNYRTELDLVHTEEEIRAMVNRSHKEGAIDYVESELIDNVFDFVDRMAKEVMIPRQDVDCVYVEDSFEETMKTIRTTAHSRYPLCLEDKDHIIGLIHIKDLMERQREARRDLRLIQRAILTIPETMKLSTLLQYMRTRRIYLANVVDEYGGMVGLVGLEDIIEELVGDIQDEHDAKRPAVMKFADGTFEFDGMVLIDEVEDTMDIELSDVDEDTIGGFVFGQLGRPPVIGDEIQAGGYTFTVTDLQGYRIARLKVVPLPVESSSEEEEQENGEH